MNLVPEQLFAKIGMLVMENEILRAELSKLQEKKVETKNINSDDRESEKK